MPTLYELNQEEQRLSNALERGEFESVVNAKKEKERYRAFAKAMLEKNKTISIRLREGDLYDLKSIAQREGMPYQTLIASVIHKYVNMNAMPKREREYFQAGGVD